MSEKWNKDKRMVETEEKKNQYTEQEQIAFFWKCDRAYRVSTDL